MRIAIRFEKSTSIVVKILGLTNGRILALCQLSSGTKQNIEILPRGSSLAIQTRLKPDRNQIETTLSVDRLTWRAND
jgi:hypothetical protein